MKFMTILLLGMALTAGGRTTWRSPARGDLTMRTVTVLPTAGGNRWYPGNREPLRASPLIKLPVGSIRPEGWLRTQLEYMASGLTGNLPQYSHWCRFEGNAWADPQGKGECGWEELPYWLKGYLELGYVLGDERIKAEARRWVEAVLASQRGDGYFGPEANREANDLWPNMIMLYALRTFYEATGDERVLPFMSRYFAWMAKIPKDRLLPGSWQQWRGGDNLDSIHWLYNRTGETALLDLARAVHEHTADWTGGIPTWHGVNIAQGWREPAQWYQQSHDPAHLDAAVRNWQTVRTRFGQVPGGMYGADENCREGYTGPRQATETCAFVEAMQSDEMLLRITGDTRWADHCEEVAFNSLPASMTADLRALHYLTAPNLVQCDRTDKSPMVQNRGNMFGYDPGEVFRCCQHNVSHGWPYFAGHTWLATPGNGLAATLYAPSRVTARVGSEGEAVTIDEETDYPFGETVSLTILTDHPVRFPLALRIPRWCREAKVIVNGVAQETRPAAGSWVVLEASWKQGDRVNLTLPMRVQVQRWPENRNTASINRGPLTFSLAIQETYRYENPPACEVLPASPWNYALVLEEGEAAAAIKVLPDRPRAEGNPFRAEAAPVVLKARARRVPQWRQEANGLVGEVQESPVRTTEPVEEVRLIPMGCARLRITAFPVVGDGPDAHEWREPAQVQAASHCWEGDSVAALDDGILPRNSGDQGIPRFTWWDHRGTVEWVQYDFAGPRDLAWTEVYWFDDTGAGSCRVPASWRVLYRRDGEWLPVRAKSEYGTARDTFNRVAFERVSTDALRLEATLQPGVSAGILEWRVGK